MGLLRTRLAVGGVSTILVLVLGEVAARVLVATRMDPEKVRILLEDTDVKGRYRAHPRLPYVPDPGFPSHNALGFRGAEIERDKAPGRLRVACLGASTTYGHQLAWREAWPAELERLLVERGYDVEVVNAGVPGWVSLETLVGLEERVLPLAPDLVVVYQGRNELFPQSYRNYEPDYSHYRDPAWNFSSTNTLHKAVFRVSHLALLLCTHRGQRFGWEERLENPVYGCVVKSNAPEVEEIGPFLEDPSRTGAYRHNVEELVRISRAAGARVLLTTFAFRVDDFATGNLPEDPRSYPALDAQVRENNDVVRAIGEERGVSVAETAALAEEPALFRDDCHVTPEGHTRRARIVLERILADGLLPAPD